MNKEQQILMSRLAAYYGKQQISDKNILEAYKQVVSKMDEEEFIYMVNYYFDPLIEQKFFPSPKEMIACVYRIRNLAKDQAPPPDTPDNEIMPHEEVRKLVKGISERLRNKGRQIKCGDCYELIYESKQEEHEKVCRRTL